MTVFFILLTLGVIAVVAGVAVGRIEGGLDGAATSIPDFGLPEGSVTVEALAEVRFSQALRGYRMDQVDEVLDRLVEALIERDQEISRLQAGSASEPTDEGFTQLYTDESAWRSEAFRVDPPGQSFEEPGGEPNFPQSAPPGSLAGPALEGQPWARLAGQQLLPGPGPQEPSR